MRRLKAAGFVELSERQGWEGVQKGGRYFFTRNASTLVAFAVGQQYEPGNGFMMVGAHTDRCAAPARVPDRTQGAARRAAERGGPKR